MILQIFPVMTDAEKRDTIALFELHGLVQWTARGGPEFTPKAIEVLRQFAEKAEACAL